MELTGYVLNFLPEHHSASISHVPKGLTRPFGLVMIGATSLVFHQRRSGAKRGQSPTWYPFTPEDLKTMRLMATAPALVDLLERFAVATDPEQWVSHSAFQPLRDEARGLVGYIERG